MLVASTSEIFSHIGVALPSFIFPNMILFTKLYKKIRINIHIPFTQSNLNKVVFMKSYRLYAILTSHIAEQYKSRYFSSFLRAVCGILT